MSRIRVRGKDGISLVTGREGAPGWGGRLSRGLEAREDKWPGMTGVDPADGKAGT